MHTLRLGTALLVLLLAACAPAAAPVDTTASSQPIPYEQALNRTFSSQTLGIALRYPSTAMVGDCADPFPVTAVERAFSVAFTLDHAPDADCASVAGNVFAKIHAQRANDLADVRAFIDRVFSPDCEIAEQQDVADATGDDFTLILMRSKDAPKDAPDFACGESIVWNRTAGVVLFSSLGSKMGGGVEWPSPTEILMPDGSTERIFDFLIMDSIRFLKP